MKGPVPEGYRPFAFGGFPLARGLLLRARGRARFWWREGTMNEDIRRLLARHWFAFTETQGRSPSRTEWKQVIREANNSGLDALCGPAPGDTDDLAVGSFRALDILEAMEDDLHLKSRAAWTNSYCRKYVDGSF